MPGIKIRIIKDPETGEDCVPPKCMELLLGFAEHKKIYAECEKVGTTEDRTNCPVGLAFLEELSRQPEVEPA